MLERPSSCSLLHLLEISWKNENYHNNKAGSCKFQPCEVSVRTVCGLFFKLNVFFSQNLKPRQLLLAVTRTGGTIDDLILTYSVNYIASGDVDTGQYFSFYSYCGQLPGGVFFVSNHPLTHGQCKIHGASYN